MDLLPASISWAALAVLLVRGLLVAAPRIVDAVSRALVEREAAKRMAAEAVLADAEAGLAEVQRGAANDERREHEIDVLTRAVEQLRADLGERERLATEAIHAAEVDHAHTRERLDVCERDLRQCTTEHQTTKRQLSAMSAELMAIRKEMIR